MTTGDAIVLVYLVLVIVFIAHHLSARGAQSLTSRSESSAQPPAAPDRRAA